jgi:predicted small lipoprotein YifL
MRFSLLRLLFLLCALYALSGCGKKGVLYLPDPAEPAPATVQSTQPEIDTHEFTLSPGRPPACRGCAA